MIVRKKVNVNRLKLYIQGSDNTKEDPTKEAGYEFCDDHNMTYANKLLQQQFPDLDGLQSPLLSQNDGFCLVKSDCDSVQIHHTRQ